MKRIFAKTEKPAKPFNGGWWRAAGSSRVRVFFSLHLCEA
jgi:hypothetical protein